MVVKSRSQPSSTVQTFAPSVAQRTLGGVGGAAAVVRPATRNQKPQDLIFSLVSCVVR